MISKFISGYFKTRHEFNSRHFRLIIQLVMLAVLASYEASIMLAVLVAGAKTEI